MCILRDGNWKKAVVWAGGGMSRVSLLLVCVCVCEAGEGWADGHNQASNVALTTKY